MPNIITVDWNNRLFVEINNGSPAVNEMDAVEIYSEWKQALLDDSSKLGWPQAMTPVGGDPRTATQSLGITRFLENGWRIRPAEYSHKLTVNGNLFTREPGQSIFKPTVGAFNVHTETVVSNVIDKLEDGAYASLIADAVWDEVVTGHTGVTNGAGKLLVELFRLAGLDPTKPLVVSTTARKVPSSGADITQTIGESAGVVTVTRTV